MREVLRAELKSAMRARDRVAVGALRAAIAAIDNAQAVPVGTPLPDSTGGGTGEGEPIAGSVVGVGNSEVLRRELSESEVRAVVTSEVTEQEDHAATYDRLGQAEQAERLRAEAAVLRGVLARA